ncbi:hypothetical protein WN66_01611 [Saccharomyces cerevisiae]|nr:hypothetical protein WN66_01611 [Saccharomyces cerevisiae]
MKGSKSHLVFTLLQVSQLNVFLFFLGFLLPLFLGLFVSLRSLALALSSGWFIMDLILFRTFPEAELYPAVIGKPSGLGLTEAFEFISISPDVQQTEGNIKYNWERCFNGE